MKKLCKMTLGIALLGLVASCSTTGSHSHHYAGLQDRWTVNDGMEMPEISPPKKKIDTAPMARAVLRGDKIEILENVQFETGSDHILDESHGVLDEVAAILDEHAEIEHIRVEGHTDSQGKPAANQKLSAERAEAVRTYLIENDGIAPERLMAEGFGDTQPIADNDTDEGRAQNRRVEFVVVH